MQHADRIQTPRRPPVLPRPATIALLGVGLLGTITASPVNAGFQLAFDATSYNVSISLGSTVNVNVFLHQSAPIKSGEPDLSSVGLFGVALQVVTSQQVQLLSITPPTLDASDPLINLPNKGRLDYSYQFEASPTVNRNGNIFLGSFTFSGLTVGVASLMAQVDSVFTNGSGFGFVADNGDGLDSQIQASNAASIKVSLPSAVPEPSSLALSGMALAIGVVSSRRSLGAARP